MLRNSRLERMEHWIVTQDHRPEHVKQHEKNDLNTEPWKLNNIKTWNLCGVRGCFANFLRMFVMIFSRFPKVKTLQQTEPHHYGHMGLLAGAQRLTQDMGSGTSLGISRDLTHCLYLFILQVKMAGPFQIRLFFWAEIAIMYFSLIYTQTLVTTAPEHGSLHCQLEDYSIFSHESSEVNWHFPPFFDEKYSFTQSMMANTQLPNLLLLVGFSPSAPRHLRSPASLHFSWALPPPWQAWKRIKGR